MADPNAPAGFVDEQTMAAQIERMDEKVREQLYKRVDHDFRYHRASDINKARSTEIRSEARSLAEVLVARCPAGRELETALTHLESAVMFANAAIARHG